MIDIWGTPILAEVRDIVNLLRADLEVQGIPYLSAMKPTNRNIMVSCPAHKDGLETKPSCGISTVEMRENNKVYPAGTVHCFTCGYTADLPKLISHVYGHNDGGQFGYKWIMSRYAAVQIEHRKPLELPDMTRGKKSSQQEQTFVSESELASYRHIHPYMYERKLNDKVIYYFDVGFDHVKNALTFPVKDLNGNVPFVQRRGVAGKIFDNEADAKKGNVVYGMYEVYKNLSWIREIYICESIIDALTCWTHRVAAVATLGAMPTMQQIKILQQCPVRKYVSAYDNDEAGIKGTAKLKETLGRTKLMARLEFPGEVKDVNEMTEEQFANRETTLSF